MSGCLDFKMTGVLCIDNIINALEDASAGYHSTYYWNDSDNFDPVSYADKLQAAFDCAAKEFNDAKADTEHAADLEYKKAQAKNVLLELIDDVSVFDDVDLFAHIINLIADGKIPHVKI